MSLNGGNNNFNNMWGSHSLMGDVSGKSNSKDNSLISMWSDKSLKDDLKKDNCGKGFGGMGAGTSGKEKGSGKSAK